MKGKNITGCPAGWSFFESNCYKVFTKTLSGQDAENFCLGEGGHLTSIHSREENDFVALLDSDEMRIGGTDVKHEGTFVWTDGSSFTFTNWEGNNPNEGGNQDCVTINHVKSGFWDDANCSKQHNDYLGKFVCKKRKIQGIEKNKGSKD